MSKKIQIKRGRKAGLPILEQGELGYTLDTKELFIGDGVDNVLVNDLSGVLTRTNTDEYIPTSDFHPATKKYVDDEIGGLALGDTNVIEEVRAQGVALPITNKSVNITRSSLGAGTGNANVFSFNTEILNTDTWTDETGFFTLQKTVNGIKATDKPIVDLNLATATVANVEDIQAAWSTIYRVVTGEDTATFYALEEPTFPENTVISLQVVR